jgi:hypothetical protein
LDPLSVAWELLPWSFVVDWFIPIGSYLDLVNQVPSLKGRFLTTTVRTRTNSKNPRFTGALYGNPPNGIDWWDHKVLNDPLPFDKWRSTTLTRTYSESLSVPLPQMHLGGAVQGRRFWNALGLAHQRFASAAVEQPLGTRRRGRSSLRLVRSGGVVV